MQEINVARRFTIQIKVGEHKTFLPGKQLVDDAIANHYYTKLHLVKDVVQAGIPQHPEPASPHTTKPPIPEPSKSKKRR